MENALTTRQLHREYSFNHIYLDFLNKMIAENMIKNYLLQILYGMIIWT